MILQIITPEKTIYNGEIQSVTLPGMLGSFEVLENHAPIISSLTKGKISYVLPSGEQNELETDKGGFVEVSQNIVSVCIE
ncbi:MAG: F0F1 ATP synthase subunit epsilon [Paludibacter sp.]|nr:F0F1 ATP synthase subunit epsilon [Paludibacter sp.]